MTTPLETLTTAEWDALIISIVKRYFGLTRFNSAIDIDDLKQEAWHALMRACQNHDPDKAAKSGVKFSTYAYAYIDGQLRRYVSTHCKVSSYMKTGGEKEDAEHWVDLEAMLDPVDGPSLEASMADAELTSKIFKLAANEKHYDILMKHFVHNKTYRQIGKELGVSHALIGQRIHAMLEKIQEQLGDDYS
jgi:RNA polymerase sigma factor (sigma-70 family)